MAITINDPNSNVFDNYNPSQGMWAISAHLLGRDGTPAVNADDDIGAGVTTTGPWIDTRMMKTMSVHVFGTFAGSIQLQASNESQPQASDTNGVNLGSAITTPEIIALTGPYRFVRAVATLSSGAVAASIHGVS